MLIFPTDLVLAYIAWELFWVGSTCKQHFVTQIIPLFPTPCVSVFSEEKRNQTDALQQPPPPSPSDTSTTPRKENIRFKDWIINLCLCFNYHHPPQVDFVWCFFVQGGSDFTFAFLSALFFNFGLRATTPSFPLKRGGRRVGALSRNITLGGFCLSLRLRQRCWSKWVWVMEIILTTVFFWPMFNMK